MLPFLWQLRFQGSKLYVKHSQKTLTIFNQNSRAQRCSDRPRIFQLPLGWYLDVFQHFVLFDKLSYDIDWETIFLQWLGGHSVPARSYPIWSNRISAERDYWRIVVQHSWNMSSAYWVQQTLWTSGIQKVMHEKKFESRCGKHENQLQFNHPQFPSSYFRTQTKQNTARPQHDSRTTALLNYVTVICIFFLLSIETRCYERFQSGTASAYLVGILKYPTWRHAYFIVCDTVLDFNTWYIYRF